MYELIDQIAPMLDWCDLEDIEVFCLQNLFNYTYQNYYEK